MTEYYDGAMVELVARRARDEGYEEGRKKASGQSYLAGVLVTFSLYMIAEFLRWVF